MNPKDEIGRTKPPLHVLPWRAVYIAAAALVHGKEKYGLLNWREHAIEASNYHDAALRHLTQYWEGEDADQDSGLPHLAHAAATLLILLDATLAGKCKDDRGPKSPPGWMGETQAQVRALLARHAKSKAP